MEFAIISPTAGLERYSTLSKVHLVLAGVYNDNHEYRSFYNKRREDKDFIILDNGAYEGHTFEVTPHDYPNLRPDVVVLPDHFLQPWKKTWHAAIAHLDKWYDSCHYTKWLYIPQAEEGDLHGFIESYQRAIEDPRITWLGIPRALAYAITNDPLMRVKFAQQVKQDRPDIKLHAFGMVNGDVHELPYLAHAGVESVDSSAPVWRGWNGFDIKDTPGWDKHGTPVDFNSPFVSNDEVDFRRNNINALINHNLEACGVRTTQTG